MTATSVLEREERFTRDVMSSTASTEVLGSGDPMARALLQLDRARHLTDDWDSYGSPPPSEEVIDVVEALIEATQTQLRPFLPAPYVVPVPGGGIQLEWERGDRALELEFGPIEDSEIHVEFLRVSHGEPVSEGEVLNVGELFGHVYWVIEG